MKNHAKPANANGDIVMQQTLQCRGQSQHEWQCECNSRPREDKRLGHTTLEVTSPVRHFVGLFVVSLFFTLSFLVLQCLALQFLVLQFFVLYCFGLFDYHFGVTNLGVEQRLVRSSLALAFKKTVTKLSDRVAQTCLSIIIRTNDLGTLGCPALD